MNDTNDDSDAGGESGARKVVVGILATPNLPTRLAKQLKDRLPDELARRVDNTVEWSIELLDDPFESKFPDYPGLLDKAHERVRRTEWAVALCLTDLPLRDGPRDIVVADLRQERHVGLVSIPALGGSRLYARLRRLAVPMIDHLLHAGPPDSEQPSTELPDARRPVRSRTRRHDSGDLVVTTPRSGMFRLLGGMVRANRPWQLVLGLSTALASALAGIAFGLLYSSVWTLATAMGPIRLSGLALVAVCLLVSWLIVFHNLWEPRTNRSNVPDLELRLRNAGTVATVAVGAVAFCATLFTAALAGAALIIPPDYLTTTLGRPVDVSDYVTIALMAAILGTLAGSIGSGMEDHQAVRNATYGQREQQRHRRIQQQREQT